jgi:hypothetical protein
MSSIKRRDSLVEVCDEIGRLDVSVNQVVFVQSLRSLKELVRDLKRRFQPDKKQ